MPQAALPAAACKVVAVDGQKILQKSGDMGRGMCHYTHFPKHIAAVWPMHHASVQGFAFASGTGRMGLAEAEVGKGGAMQYLGRAATGQP